MTAARYSSVMLAVALITFFGLTRINTLWVIFTTHDCSLQNFSGFAPDQHGYFDYSAPVVWMFAVMSFLVAVSSIRVRDVVSAVIASVCALSCAAWSIQYPAADIARDVDEEILSEKALSAIPFLELDDVLAMMWVDTGLCGRPQGHIIFEGDPCKPITLGD